MNRINNLLLLSNQLNDNSNENIDIYSEMIVKIYINSNPNIIEDINILLNDIINIIKNKKLNENELLIIVF